MSDPVLIAVPPKGGSFDDVLKKLVVLGWLRPDLVTAIRALIKGDKRRVKLEEGLIALWERNGRTAEGAMRAADLAGHDLDEVEQALRRMRRYRDSHGAERLDYTPETGVALLLDQVRRDSDPEVSEAAMCLHLQLDLTRPGKPSRMVFNFIAVEIAPTPGAVPVRTVIMGTEHEVTPTYLRRQKRDLSLTCYDAFHSNLLDVLDTPQVRNWQELRSHLKTTSTDVRILGTLGLDDYLGHCVLMSAPSAAKVAALGSSRRWADPAGDPKLDLLRGRTVLIDPQYQDIYSLVLDAPRNGITFATGPKDIERVCAEEDQVGIYIVRSGSTVVLTPGLCVVGEEIITSETIVAVNEDARRRNPAIDGLIAALNPQKTDHAPAWRAQLAAKLGERLI